MISIFYAFDLLFAGGEDLRTLAADGAQGAAEADCWQARQGERPTTIRYVEHFETGGEAILQSACRLSLEGIVSKSSTAPYRSGRSENWTKAKCRAGHEVVLGGWKTTNGKFRSLMAGVHRGDHLVLCRSGRHRLQRRTRSRRIMPALKAAASDKSPFGGKDAPRKTRDVHWLKPELVAEIEFAGFTGDGNDPAGRVQGPAPGQAGGRGQAEEPAMTRDRKFRRNAAAKSGKARTVGGREQIRRGDGRGDLEARQGAVAGRRRRQGASPSSISRVISRRSATG